MRKIEKEELQKLFNSYTEVKEEMDECFTELQNMSRELGLSVYCSAWDNYKQLSSNDHIYRRVTTYGDRARYMYEKYLKLSGQEEALMNLGKVLARVGFWKGE